MVSIKRQFISRMNNHIETLEALMSSACFRKTLLLKKITLVECRITIMLTKHSDNLALHIVNELNFVLEYFFQSIAIIVNILLKVLQMVFIGHNLTTGTKCYTNHRWKIYHYTITFEMCVHLSFIFVYNNLFNTTIVFSFVNVCNCRINHFTI